MRPIIAAAKLLLFCHLGKFFALFFHKTAEIVAFTPFSATISTPFQPIDTPSAAHVFGAEIMVGSREKTDAERGIIGAFTESADASDEDAGAFAEDIVRIAEGTYTLPEGTFTVAEGTFRIIARRDMDISWIEMIFAELDTGIAYHEITLMGCCMEM